MAASVSLDLHIKIQTQKVGRRVLQDANNSVTEQGCEVGSSDS